MERNFEENLKHHESGSLAERAGSAMPYPGAESQQEEIQEDTYYFDDEQVDGLEAKDAYLESIMDYMAEGNPGSSSVIEPQANDNLLEDYLLQINHDEEDNFVTNVSIRQSLQRLQQDFYGDDSVQQLIADDSEIVLENNASGADGGLEGVDDGPNFAEHLEQLHNVMQHKSRSEMLGAASSSKEATSSLQDAPKKNTKVLQKKLNIAEKKLAQKMPKFKELNDRLQNNEQVCHKLIATQTKSAGSSSGNDSEIFSSCYQHFLEQLPSIQGDEIDEEDVERQQQSVQDYIASQCGPSGHSIAEQLLCHFY